MNIKNHIIEGIPFKQSPNIGKVVLSNPSLVLIHYTGAKTASSAINWMLDKTAKVSAHLHLDREGKLVQLVKFNQVAYHAGVSEWRGIKGLNSHSIGIEIQNDGTQKYTEAQIKTLIELCKALKEAYPSIKEYVGHTDVAGNRKVDPEGLKGNLFNWVEFRAKMGLPNKVYKTSSGLNMRRWNSTDYAVITTLPKDAEVIEIHRLGDWSRVQYGEISGYVSNKYLTPVI